MSTDMINLMITIVSASTAIISVIFAWMAVKVAKRSNVAAHVAELHNLYRSENNFHATQVVWKLYRKYQQKSDDPPITNKQAEEFLDETDKKSETWEAVHNTWVYWSYLTLLLNRGFIDEPLAMSGIFGSMGILGFLYPIEKAFIEKSGMTYKYNESLQSLYDRWKRQMAKKKSAKRTG